MALSSSLAADLSDEEETALRLTCGEAENGIQRICRERELRELAAVPRPGGLARLSLAERQQLEAKCSKARGYGPAELRRCEAIELSRRVLLLSGRGKPGSGIARQKGERLPIPAERPALAGQSEAGPRLATSDLRELQQLLHERGYYAGKIDGQYGQLTARAIQGFETAQGRHPTGLASAALLAELHSLDHVASAKVQPGAVVLDGDGRSLPAGGSRATESLPTLVAAASSQAATLATSVHAIAVAPAGSVEAAEVRALDGVAIVLDGDTLEIGGVPVRLYGIDAPESNQMCVAHGRRYQCGRQAAFELADRIGGRSVSCTPQAAADPGPITAVCSLGNEPLNAWMVREGWAVADPGHPGEYGSEEASARSERRGMWIGEFSPPWEWRERLQARQANQSS